MKKIIYTADISAQTKKFDNALSDIKTLISKYKGYIASSSSRGGDKYYLSPEKGMLCGNKA